MGLKVLTYNEIAREEWRVLVKNSAAGTWFQTPEAFDFFESLPELFKPFVVGVASPKPSPKGKGEQPPSGSALKGRVGVRPLLRAVCVGYVTKEKSRLKQFFTRRAIIIGGPVIADDASSEEAEALMRAVVESVGCKVYHTHYIFNITQNLSSPIYIETRNFNDYSRWKGTFEKVGFEYKKHLNFHVNCKDKEEMWERLSENRKRQIRKAEKVKGLEIRGLEVTEAEVREWYEILKRLYKTKVKTPLWPVEFFLEAYRQRIGHFSFIKHNGKIIGGSMAVMDEGTVYEWFECGMNSEYKEQYPSVMATWAGMTFANEKGCRRYDMMGAGEPDVPYGVRDFKSEFGGELVEHGRFICVMKPLLYKVGIFGVKILKGKKL